jgi:plasmid stabilization system protein ParE
LKVHFLSPAEREYLKALRYYTARSPSIGAAFLDDLDHAVALLADHPNAGSPYDADTRRLLLKRFRHSLIYKVMHDEVVIVAVAHQSRQPKSWRERD